MLHHVAQIYIVLAKSFVIQLPHMLETNMLSCKLACMHTQHLFCAGDHVKGPPPPPPPPTHTHTMK
ncbi:uncharacterized protein MEPE_03352 [Melanopsichium pennsylvanicum]|uniref:Uncharacterized protein n=1 Tax=Melanopsichium pennsylvanicum TaxID=63383 RepID=A0AAJ5C5J9_9BASI|nr:uncharacterized protein MEPE_03352 [Melanopsichium pennsylvanicum]